jgi:hypothetical protein
MSEVEYVLRIVLRLRDEATRKLAAVAAEVESMNKSFDGSTAKMNAFNTSVLSISDNVEGLTDRMSNLHSVIQKFGDDSDLDHIAASVDRAGESLERVGLLRQALQHGEAKITVVHQEEQGVGRTGRAPIEQAFQSIIDRAQQAFHAGEEPNRPFVRGTKEQLNEMFEVVEGVNKSGKKMFQVLDRTTGELLGQRAREQRLDALQQKLYRDRIGNQQKLAQEEAQREENADLLNAQRQVLDIAIKEAQARGTIVDDLKQEVAARQQRESGQQEEIVARQQNTEAIKKETVSHVEAAPQHPLQQAEEEDPTAARNRTRLEEFNRLRARAADIGIQTEDRSITVLKELITKRERQIKNIDDANTIMRGDVFSIQDLGQTLRIVNERLKIIAGGGFRSFDAATDAMNLMAKFQVDTVTEAREAEREWIGGKRLERVIVGKRADVEEEATQAVKEETALRKQNIDVSKPQLAAYDKLNKAQQDYVDGITDEVLAIKDTQNKTFRVTTALRETEDHLINWVETLDKAGRSTNAFEQKISKEALRKPTPPIGGGAPGDDSGFARLIANQRQILEDLSRQIREFSADVLQEHRENITHNEQLQRVLDQMTEASRKLGALEAAKERAEAAGPRIAATGGGGEPPGRRPQTAEGVFDDDQERAFEKHKRKVNELGAEFQRLMHTLDALRNNFASGRIEEDEFFHTAERLSSEFEKLSRRAPVDFAEKIGFEFKKAAEATKQQVERFKELAGQNVVLRDLMQLTEQAAGRMNKFTDSLDDLTTSADVSRGAMVILRREGERMRDLSLTDLTTELETANTRLRDLKAEAARAGSTRHTVHEEAGKRSATSHQPRASTALCSVRNTP